jgi:nicotinic acid mononucleotide adenylyltransferase
MSDPVSAPAPASITKINYLFPGSFSPVTVSHVGAVEKLLAGEGLTDDEKKIAPPPKITVYIIPVSDKYNKDSVKPGTSVYLSEKTRKEFLETAVQPLVEKGGSVIVSDAEFEYGKGGVKDVQPGKAPPTDFLAVNYNQPVRTNGETYLEHPENFVNAETYLILGADNAYVDMVGWADPKTILDNMKILVIARGEPPKKPVKRYYKHDGTIPNIPNTDTVDYQGVVDERNRIYGKSFPDYDLQKEMNEKIVRLDFTVAEASSSLIRSLVFKPEDVSLDEVGGKPCELERVLIELRANGKVVPNFDEYSTDLDGVKKIKSEQVGELVKALTPIPIDALKQEYPAAAAAAAAAAPGGAAAAPGGGARSKKTKRRKGRRNSRSKTRKRRLTNKRRGNRRRNRTHH